MPFTFVNTTIGKRAHWIFVSIIYLIFLCLRIFFVCFCFLIFIVIQLHLYAFSPHPSTPPQLNPTPSPTSTLPLGFVHVSFIVVPIIPSPHCPSANKWIKKTMVHLHNGILCSREKEGAYTLCNSMDGTGEHYAKCLRIF